MTQFTLLAEQADAILRSALESEFGVQVHIIRTGDMVAPALRARSILYRFRREIPNPDFQYLQIKLHPDDPDNRLWIIKRNAPVTQHGDDDPADTPSPLTREISLEDL